MSPSKEKSIVFTISLAFLIEFLDSTVLNTTIPTMALGLHVNPLDLKIALISYLLSSAANSIMNTVQQLALSFWVAIGALLIRFFSHTSLESTLTLTAFHRTFLAIGTLTFLSMCIFAQLKNTDGDKMISL